MRKTSLTVSGFVLAVLAALPLAAEVQEKPKIGVVVLPVLFNMPETKWGGGIGGLLTYRPAGSEPSARPSSLYFYAIYTQKKQFSTKWEPEVYLAKEKYLLKGRFIFEKYPEKFWGVGRDVADEREEDYTPRSFVLEASFQKKIWPARNLYLGLLYQFENFKILKTEEGGQLAAGTWPGSSGGTISGAGFIVNWDTRDNVFYPSRGKFWQFSTAFCGSFLGSDFDYTSIKLDLRTFFPALPSHVLGVQALYQAAAGTPPFKSYAKLGGDCMMRGYYSGRYRDKNLLAVQAEYRLPVWWRFGLVGFAGVANVAEKLGGLGLKDLKYSLGTGIRFKVAPKEGTNLRLDFAWGKGTSGFYFTAGEAF